MTGHTITHARILNKLGGVILCRRHKAPGRREATGALIYRFLRAGCLTGCRAEKLVSPELYPDYFPRATHSYLVATLGDSPARME